MTWEDVVPMPGNPIYPRRLMSMRREWGGYVEDLVGNPVVATNNEKAFPDLDAEALVVIDGCHRRELAREDARLDHQFLAEVHRGLNRAQVHRLRRGRNDRRTVKPAERFLEMCAEGDVTKNAIKDTVEGVGWRVTHERAVGGLSCTNELEWIWHNKSGKAAMVRSIETYAGAWGEEPHKEQARVIKGLGAFWLMYPDADLERLIRVLQKVTPGVVYTSGKRDADQLAYLRKVVYQGIRHTLANLYNKGYRGRKLPVGS
jgi:hypothetical protein